MLLWPVMLPSLFIDKTIWSVNVIWELNQWPSVTNYKLHTWDTLSSLYEILCVWSISNVAIHSAPCDLYCQCGLRSLQWRIHCPNLCSQPLEFCYELHFQITSKSFPKRCKIFFLDSCEGINKHPRNFVFCSHNERNEQISVLKLCHTNVRYWRGFLNSFNVKKLCYDQVFYECKQRINFKLCSAIVVEILKLGRRKKNHLEKIPLKHT